MQPRGWNSDSSEKKTVLTQNFKLLLPPLVHRYELGKKLVSVLYFHQISDFRMDWISMMNFKIFQKLCGKSTLRNAVIVTNMWGQVDLQVGEAREDELMREDTFFKPVFDQGARIARNQNTVTSAQNIIRLVLNNRPLTLCIQRELVNEHMDIYATSASKELHREINAQVKKHQEEMRVVKEMRMLREETHVLKEETHVLREEVRLLKEEMRAMRVENDETRRKHEETRMELQKMQQEAETR